jgi:hypothetical protein
MAAANPPPANSRSRLESMPQHPAQEIRRRPGRAHSRTQSIDAQIRLERHLAEISHDANPASAELALRPVPDTPGWARI